MKKLLGHSYTNQSNQSINQSLFCLQVSTEDCMYALEETSWDVHAAVKLTKLKQLLSAELGDKTTCKNALIDHAWDVEKAANYLASSSSSAMGHYNRGRESPELVHV